MNMDISSKDMIASRDVTDWDWNSEYAFHRHCQKTVCSAYGYQAGGKTWETLVNNATSTAQWATDLLNIQSFMDSGTYWQ